MRMLHFALIQPHITYGITGWGGAYDYHLNRLSVIQKLFFKVVMKKKKAYAPDCLFDQSQLFDIQQLILADTKKESTILLSLQQNFYSID